MSRHDDTIAALATPTGTAALAVIRVSGPDTKLLATEMLGRPPLPRRAVHSDYRDRSGALVDDVVLTFFAGPRSYTGEDALELSCHGNPFIAQRILEDLYARGCRPAQPGEFTQRAFLHGRLDLSQAEAVMDVIHAGSERALAAAQDQLRGALGRRMNGLVERLLGVLARVEAYIDFPDEDLPQEDRDLVARELAGLRADTQRLLATSHFGQMLRDGIKTVIVGRPNVGKSSLLNRLVGRERALVSPEAGTTRDFIEERILIGGHALRLIDTAGLNASPGELERLGMEKTYERIEEADLLLVVVDSADCAPPPVLNGFVGGRNAFIVLNKSDLGDLELPSWLPAGCVAYRVSAKTGAGIGDLEMAIGAWANRQSESTGPDTVAVSARHAHALTTACAALEEAERKLGGTAATELLASELRTSLAAFGEITGRIDNERMLDQLFASFCIGK